MKYLVFDFNGTVIDDVGACLKAENRTIEHFGLDRRPLELDEYLRIFTFPVKKYYEAVGFDWSRNSYEEVGQYWFGIYRSLKDECKLHKGVKQLLVKNRSLGNKNVVLSASHLQTLKQQLEELEVIGLFDEILGIGDIYAGSKAQIGLDWIADKDPGDCLMIGDTLHDLEVAKLMGIDCVLVANGHQAKEILLENWDKVYDDIREVDICA